MNAVRIVQATPEIAPKLAAFGKKAFDAAFGALNKPLDHKAYVLKAFSVEQMEKELKNSENIFYLLYLNEKLSGYIKMRTGPLHDEVVNMIRANKPVELQRIYVESSLVGKGLGGRLMDTCLDHAVDNGHDAIWLGTWDINEKAIRFYERHGFTIVGNRTFVVGDDQQNDVVMVKYFLNKNRLSRNSTWVCAGMP